MACRQTGLRGLQLTKRTPTFIHMIRLLAIFSICFSLAGQGVAQEALILDIRREYQRIVSEKASYKQETEHYNWEEDELIPSLSEEQLEYEYNEHGNYTATKTSFYNARGALRLVVLEDKTSLYQENQGVERIIEYYFRDEGLFFCFVRQKEFLGPSGIRPEVKVPIEKACEIRIYLASGEVIRYLRKEKEEEGLLDQSSVDMSSIENESIALDALEEVALYVLEAYEEFIPPWQY